MHMIVACGPEAAQREGDGGRRKWASQAWWAKGEGRMAVCDGSGDCATGSRAPPC